MVKARKKIETTDARTLAKLQRAFVSAPTEASDHEVVLLRLARGFGVSRTDAIRTALWNEWYIEREARCARAWAAKNHPGAPLDLEGFAAYYAARWYSHLDRREALAWGRAIWYRALVPVAHWEAARIVVESRNRNTKRCTLRSPSAKRAA